MSVKRYTLRSIYKALSSGQDLEMPDCDVIAETDYDALDAQFAELRQHLGTLTPGGSHTCITCAAHVKVITEDLEPRIRTLEAELAVARNDRLGADLLACDRISSLEAELAVEKMQHSVTIADEHESRSEFQDRIRALEAERDDVVEARGEMARENVRLATELAEWRELYEFGLKDRNELLDRAQTAEAYAARNALRVIEVEGELKNWQDLYEHPSKMRHASDRIRSAEKLLREMVDKGSRIDGWTVERPAHAWAVEVSTFLATAETKSAPSFCPECLMTGGHKLRCSKAETTPKPITTFTGWIQGSCDNCGKSAREHVGISMGCPQAETFGVKP